MKKEKFQPAHVEVVTFIAQDVLTASLERVILRLFSDGDQTEWVGM